MRARHRQARQPPISRARLAPAPVNPPNPLPLSIPHFTTYMYPTLPRREHDVSVVNGTLYIQTW